MLLPSIHARLRILFLVSQDPFSTELPLDRGIGFLRPLSDSVQPRSFIEVAVTIDFLILMVGRPSFSGLSKKPLEKQS